MKLVLQISLGVFFGTLTSQLAINYWQAHQEYIAKSNLEKLRSEREKMRAEQGERIRDLLLQSRQVKPSNKNKPESVFVPDDAQKP